MDLKRRPGPEYFEQMAFDLDLPEEERGAGGYVTPEEAQRRSLAAQGALTVMGQASAPMWFEQYTMLLAAGWPWRVACYIAWASSPKKSRWPRTQEELATAVLGLTSDRQVATWRKRNPGIDEVISVLQALPLVEHRADIYAALIESATNPDHRNHPDREMALELLGDYTKQVKVDTVHGPDQVSEMSDAELDALAQRILKGNQADGAH